TPQPFFDCFKWFSSLFKSNGFPFKIKYNTTDRILGFSISSFQCRKEILSRNHIIYVTISNKITRLKLSYWFFYFFIYFISKKYIQTEHNDTSSDKSIRR